MPSSIGSGVELPKGFRRGTHRTVSPAATLRRVSGLHSAMGITRVANVTGLDCIGIPVAQAYRPNARSLSVSQGKGLDLECAKASAVMEAVELYHAERISLPLRLSSWRELRLSQRVVPVESLPRVGPRMFDPDRALLWIEGQDLMTSQSAWVPYEMVHMDYRLPLPTGSGCLAMSSSGLASGNHRIEAICHAVCELIERDASALFRCLPPAAQEQRRVNLGAVGEADVRSILDAYSRAGVAVAVWDITSDVGVPTFRCAIEDLEPNVFRQIPATEGTGCHVAREIALVRALTEAAQARLTFIAGARDDIGRGRHARLRDAVTREGRNRPLRSGGLVFEETSTGVNESFDADLAFLSAAIATVGLGPVIVIDLTKPEFEIPVVRVIIPGLEGHPGVLGYLPGSRARNLQEAKRTEVEACA